MAAVSVGPNRIVLERLSEKFIRESERILGGDLVDYYIEFFEYD